jgi:hypothetical protein
MSNSTYRSLTHSDSRVHECLLYVDTLMTFLPQEKSIIGPPTVTALNCLILKLMWKLHQTQQSDIKVYLFCARCRALCRIHQRNLSSSFSTYLQRVFYPQIPLVSVDASCLPSPFLSPLSSQLLYPPTTVTAPSSYPTFPLLCLPFHLQLPPIPSLSDSRLYLISQPVRSLFFHYQGGGRSNCSSPHGVCKGGWENEAKGG